MTRNLAILFYLALACLPCLCQDLPEFTQTEQFSSIQLTYEDLSALLNQVNNLIGAQKTARNLPCEQTLTLKDTTASISIPGVTSSSSFKDAPPVSYSIYYVYRCSGAPISRLELGFYDFERQIVVSGSSKEHVQALAALITEGVKKWQYPLGGSKSRAFAGLILFIIGGSLGMSGLFIERKRLSNIIGAFGLALVISVWIFPWDQWLPGTAIYSGSASFLTRYGPEISFIGAFLTFISLVIAVWAMSGSKGNRIESAAPISNRRASRRASKAK